MFDFRIEKLIFPRTEIDRNFMKSETALLPVRPTTILFFKYLRFTLTNSLISLSVGTANFSWWIFSSPIQTSSIRIREKKCSKFILFCELYVIMYSSKERKCWGFQVGNVSSLRYFIPTNIKNVKFRWALMFGVTFNQNIPQRLVYSGNQIPRLSLFRKWNAF